MASSSGGHNLDDWRRLEDFNVRGAVEQVEQLTRTRTKLEPVRLGLRSEGEQEYAIIVIKRGFDGNDCIDSLIVLANLSDGLRVSPGPARFDHALRGARRAACSRGEHICAHVMRFEGLEGPILAMRNRHLTIAKFA